MKEELEEGHFDGDGHFQWNKEKEITDHWLDNLDWVKIKKLDDAKKQKAAENGDGEGSGGVGGGGSGGGGGGGLADSSSDSEDDGDDKTLKKFDVIAAYRRILEFMQPKETIQRTLQRLGKKSAKISSIERFRRKKAGIIDEDAALVTEITELTNKILTKLGNMNIYEETYEEINEKFGSKLKGGGDFSLGNSSNVTADDGLDMYADDFDSKEQKKMDTGKTVHFAVPVNAAASGPDSAIDDTVQWEFKWKQDDTECHGPFPTEQMLKWSNDGYFKDGVFVKKFGAQSNFNSSNRIDFELYL